MTMAECTLASRQIMSSSLSEGEHDETIVSLPQHAERLILNRFEIDDGIWNLKSMPLETYNRDELIRLSVSIGKASRTHLLSLELDGVDGLDWSVILGQEICSLRELVVTIRSQRALGELASALCRNNSVLRLEMDYQNERNNSMIRSDEHDTTGDFDTSDDFAITNHNLLLEAIKPMERVIIRGISLHRLQTSSICNMETSKWHHLTLQQCDVTHSAQFWIESSIGSLQELVLTNCNVSWETIQSLSDSYLEYSTKRNIRKNGKRKKTRKAPLRVMNLSDNNWVKAESESDEKGDQRIGCDIQELSPLSSLASWMDTLSNLVELNLSNSARLFSDRTKGMDILCGTFNHSLRRLHLRHCGLRTSDLSLVVSTFCWLEALDLSENADLLRDLSPLLNLECLTELVLENMSEDGIEEGVTSRDNSRYSSMRGMGLAAFLQELGREERKNRDYTSGNDESGFRRHLERLTLSGNNLDGEVLKAVSSLPSLGALTLIGCQMESGGLIELLIGERCFAEEKTLPWRELYLGSNNIGDEGAITLAHYLKCQYLRSLRVLYLESNVFSVNALKVFVYEGLASSLRLQSLSLWNAGAHTANQQTTWQVVEKQMEHYLSLNKAGREVLHMDERNKGENEIAKDVYKRKTIPFDLWPNLLEKADKAYGTNALYYFLNQRPDLILPSQERDRSHLPFLSVKLHSPTHSPRGVADKTYVM
jgi:hypothetical protein